MKIRELQQRLEEVSCGIDTFDVLVYVEGKGYMEIKDVVFVKSGYGYLATAIHLGEKSKGV